MYNITHQVVVVVVKSCELASHDARWQMCVIVNGFGKPASVFRGGVSVSYKCNTVCRLSVDNVNEWVPPHPPPPS